MTETATIAYHVLSGDRRLPLILDTEHSASHHGMGVLIVLDFEADWVLDGAVFRANRDLRGNHILAAPGPRTDGSARAFCF